MSISPINILQRLLELKLQQQLQTTPQNKQISNSSAYQTICGLSAFDSTVFEENPAKCPDWDNQTIQSPAKPFEQLVEEKLADETSNNHVEFVNMKPKRPFLRKGSGLERFRMVKPSERKKSPEMADQINNEDEQMKYEKELEKELKIFEALEERAANTSFSSTNSSVLRIFNSSTPSKTSPIAEEEENWQSESEYEIQSHLDQKEIEQILQRLQNIAENHEGESTSTSICSDNEEEAISTCEKCQQLEKQLNTYGNGCEKEREALAALKKSYVEKSEQLERDYARKVKEMNEREEEYLAKMEKEREMVEKDKRKYQNLLREAQNKSNRREREEMGNLKQQLADLQETLKMKESKNGMTQARLRNQIKQLEKENRELKEQIGKLTKDNAKLTAEQKCNGQRKRRQSSEMMKENKMADTRENSLLEMTKFHTNCNVEKQYENVFRCELGRQNASMSKSDGRERVLEDGSREVQFSNGNVKQTSADGNTTTMKYFNGDIKQILLLDGMVKYFYFDKNIWQTTYADGTELIEFPEGPKEKRYKDGKCEIILPDNVVQTFNPDGSQEIRYTDGSMLEIKSNGDKMLKLANGQIEIETKEHKRREYPDGTVKILYLDGTQETRYADGRIRIRDGSGKLVMDTHS